MSPAEPLDRIRNLGICAHIDAGKTTVSERILVLSGVEHRFGRVDEGTAVMDWMPEERERGITIVSAATRLPWRDCQINLVDTPGHVDFTVEVERCMRVLDGAVLVVDAVAGVQAQSETVWRQMQSHGVPCVAFVNKCDRAGADYLAAVASLRERLGAPAMPLQYPIYGAVDGASGPSPAAGGEAVDGATGEVLRGVVDLLSQEACFFDRQGVISRAAIPANLLDEVGVLRSELIDHLVDLDDGLMAAVLEDREPSLQELRSALRSLTIQRQFVGVLCGTALRNVGIQPLLDAVVDYLPAPSDLPPIAGRALDGGELARANAEAESLCALAFKVQADAHADLTYLRVYSGRLQSGARLLNPRTGATERIGQVLRMHADSRQQLEFASAGDVVAVTGCKAVGTGDTLCDPAAPIVLEALRFPEPVIRMLVEPIVTVERDKLRDALMRMEREDPTLSVGEDDETGQWAVAGMGELHLEVCLHRLKSEFNIETRVGKPRVAYREAPSLSVSMSVQVDRPLGGQDIFGAVELSLEPLGEAAAEYQSEFQLEWSDSARSVIPAAMHAAVEQGLAASAQAGPGFGFPMVAARARILGGASSPGRDSELAFSQAASNALRDAMSEAQMVLLEPVMSIEIRSPEEFAGGILADLQSRRAEVGEVLASGVERIVRGKVALYAMVGYSTVVRSLSQGRASFSMLPAGFGPVPREELAARGLVWT